MNNENLKKKILDWFRIERLTPLFVFILAEYFVVADWLWSEDIEFPLNIILFLIGILGIDAFWERIRILERIEKKLSNVSKKNTLITWDKLPKIDGQIDPAKELCILSPAMATLINNYPTTIERTIHRGCKIKILLLNPDDNDALENWKRLQKDTVVNEEQIINTIAQLWGFMKDANGLENCEIRLSNVFIPFSMMAVDMRSTTRYSSMNVEFHGYKTRDDVRPLTILNANEDYDWFKHYKDQFDSAWNSESSKAINPLEFLNDHYKEINKEGNRLLKLKKQ